MAWDKIGLRRPAYQFYEYESLELWYILLKPVRDSTSPPQPRGLVSGI
jgi:hypothetical protein